MLFVFCVHIISCLWFFIGRYGPDDAFSWIESISIENNSLFNRYIYSFYWTIATMATTGYGDIVAYNLYERIFAIIIQLLGAIIYGYLVGNITAISSDSSIRSIVFENKIDELKQYLKDRKIPSMIRRKITKYIYIHIFIFIYIKNRYFQYLYKHRSVFDENVILSELSNNIRNQIIIEVHLDFVANCQLFVGEDRNVVCAFVTRLRPMYHNKGDLIGNESWIFREMYFLVKGEVEVFIDYNQSPFTVGLYNAGCYFGDESLILEMRSPCSFTSITYCDLYFINKDDIDEITFYFKGIKEKLTQTAKDRLANLNKIKEELKRTINRKATIALDTPAYDYDSSIRKSTPTSFHISSPSQSFRSSFIKSPQIVQPTARKQPSRIKLSIPISKQPSSKISPEIQLTSDVTKETNEKTSPRLPELAQSKKRLSKTLSSEDLTIKTEKPKLSNTITLPSSNPVSPKNLFKKKKVRRSIGQDIADLIRENLTSATHVVARRKNALLLPYLLYNGEMKKVEGDFKKKLDEIINQKNTSNGDDNTNKNNNKENTTLYQNVEQDIELYNEMNKLPKYIIHPENKYYLIYQILLFVVILFNSIEVPYRVGFNAEPDASWLFFSVLFDVIFIADIVINFFTAYYRHLDYLESDYKEIRNHYLKSTFVIDVISSIPIDLVFYLCNFNDHMDLKSYRLAKLIRYLKLLRLYKLFILFIKFTNEFQLSPNMKKFFTYAYEVIFITNFLSCLWYYITTFYPTNNWLLQIYIKDQKNNFEKYIAALYWSFTTITTVGYGDITPTNTVEMIYCSLSMLIGSIVFGYIIGGIAAVVSQFDSSSGGREKSRMNEVLAYLQENNIPKVMIDRVIKHYSFIFKLKSAFDENSFVNEMPEYLRNELILYVYRNEIPKISFFNNEKDTGFISYLLIAMSPIYCSPNDYVFHEGEIGTEMYFLIKGTVQCLGKAGTTDEVVYTNITEGNYFGEIAILMETKRTASIRALTTSHLFMLSHTELQRMMFYYDSLKEKVKNALRSTLQDMAKRNKVQKEKKEDKLKVKLVKWKKRTQQKITKRKSSLMSNSPYTSALNTPKAKPNVEKNKISLESQPTPVQESVRRSTTISDASEAEIDKLLFGGEDGTPPMKGGFWDKH